tara:strand:- start:351 stop:641 length:291 start_codon:yes stop_codon:yes gene_type:complete
MEFAMSRFESSRFDSLSDSGVHVLDPKDRAMLDAAAAETTEETEAEAHRRFLKIARELPPVRLEKVMRIRNLIARGEYLTEERLQNTVDRLLQSMR